MLAFFSWTDLNSVGSRQNAILSAATEMKNGGLLEERTDVNALARRAFVQLDGVSDKWLDTVVVNIEPDGQLSPHQDLVRLTAVMRKTPVPGCCKGERQ